MIPNVIKYFKWNNIMSFIRNKYIFKIQLYMVILIRITFKYQLLKGLNALGKLASPCCLCSQSNSTTTNPSNWCYPYICTLRAVLDNV